MFEAKDLLDTLNANVKPRALATSFDASHIVGEMTPTDIAMLGKNTATLEINGEDTEKFTLPSSADFDKCIATASRYFTLKIGDLILIENGEWHDAEINSRVTARLGDFESINIKIK